jgi:hypothetical protein
MDLENKMAMQELGGLMDISASGVISGILFGIIGMWMLGRARKKKDFRLISISFGLMFYPYFTRGPLQDWGVGAALCGLAYYLWDGRNLF